MLKLEQSSGEHMAAGAIRDGEERRKRLQTARVLAGFASMRAAALQYGWPESTYRAHENGTRSIGRDDALRYGLAYGVAGDWIYSGHGEMRGTGQSALQPNVVLSRHRNVTPYAKRMLNVYGVAEAGNEGVVILTGTPIAEVPCPTVLESVDNAYVVSIAGTSMEPRYLPREIVFVNPALSPRQYDFVVVQRRTNGDLHGYVKRFIRYTPKELVLQQLNPPREIRFPRSEVEAVHVIVLAGMGN